MFKPISCDGNLQTTNAREEHIHDLASTGTQLQNQAPANVILTDIEEENLSSDSPQAELLQWHYCLGKVSFTQLRLLADLCIIPK